MRFEGVGSLDDYELVPRLALDRSSKRARPLLECKGGQRRRRGACDMTTRTQDEQRA